MKSEATMTPAQREELIILLKARFEKNLKRHPELSWKPVQAKLEAKPDRLESLFNMERTGGEPDVIGFDDQTGEFILDRKSVVVGKSVFIGGGRII